LSCQAVLIAANGSGEFCEPRADGLERLEVCLAHNPIDRRQIQVVRFVATRRNLTFGDLVGAIIDVAVTAVFDSAARNCSGLTTVETRRSTRRNQAKGKIAFLAAGCTASQCS